jgi:nicotinate-nucleotide adenylyltransferase
MKTMYTTEVKLIEGYVSAHVSARRLFHSVSTASLARQMAIRWDLDPERAYLAGIAHDMCKEFTAQDMIRAASEDGQPIGKWMLDHPRLLHGRAAASVLFDEFGIADDEILEAVREHTFGSMSMGKLARIVYCADKIEPSRSHVDEEFRRRCLLGDIDGMLVAVVKESISFLTQEKKEIAEPTLALYAALVRRNT